MPPSFSPSSKPRTTTKTINSFFSPVKKPVENDARSKIKVSPNLKSINRSMFASKSSAFSLPNSRSGSSSSTENLTETFGKVGFNSKPKKPLIDLTSASAPRRRLKQQRRPIDSDDEDDGEDDDEMLANSDGDDDEAIVAENKRVLRERKPVMNRIIFSSDEEADLDNEEDEDEEDRDEQADEDDTEDDDKGSTSTNSKKRRQPFSDSEDDLMEDEDDQLYDEKPAKTFNLHQKTKQMKKMHLLKSHLSQLANGSTVPDKEIRAALRKDPSVVNAYQSLVTKAASTPKQVKRPRLTPKYYTEKDGVVELNDSNSNSVIEISESEQEEEDDSGDDDDDDDSDAEEGRQVENRQQKQTAVVLYFNTCSSKDFQIMTGCKSASADKLIELRPFADEDDLELKLRQTKGLSAKYIENCYEMMSGYRAVDQIIKKVENLGVKLRNTINIWEELNNSRQSSPAAATTAKSNDDDDDDDQPGMSLASISLDRAKANSVRYQDALDGYLTQQPDIVNPEMTLKDYQILGVNWMLLLYRKGISGILADEMGLGKTAQVISFLGRLTEIGETGPHLIVVPSSTIQNWEREFERFCPDLEIRVYHGSQQERIEQRMNLLHENQENEFQVIITTYNLASGHADDRKFFKRLGCQSMILDEGHMVKNCTSARYKSLMGIKTPFRLLLTGTPLQNNLQELVSLLTFIMPATFAQHEEDIRSIFKIRKSQTNEAKNSELGTAADETSIQVLAKERISRAKRMMTPFVLRRKKENVLKDLPSKEQIIELCDMTEGQAKLYNQIIEQTKKKYQAMESAATTTADTLQEQKPVVAEKRTDMQAQFEDMSNVVIHLRKAADHPLMFRNVYTDDMLRDMAKELHKDVKYWDSNLEYMYEDLTVMSDFEIDRFCREEKRIQHYSLKNQEWMDSGKIERLKLLLPKFKKEGNKVLIFSQFTKMLDILELVMQTIDISFLRLDGETKVMERQSLIDEFNDNADINVFLLSTKAGGFGINLTSANIVVLYDIDFNPQNDKQAEDRAHRVGQTKDVIIHKLICRDTIEEYILKMANMKLRLDKNMSSADDEVLEEEVNVTSTGNRQGVHSILKEAFLIADNRAK
ncbi:SNF2 family DNA-dependent ATPase [Mucor ambiguus]|uniref:DNA helicase n=1 Tax=Mucor ambiguus TaxID=91626 RepID=A0A0C9MG51_9FUNG|nr:SNF2 family DNA-dependent ATPase [Mucor ambiguus]